MNSLFRCLVVGSAFLFLGLSDDPNEKADELYAQAAQITEYQRIDAMVASARVLIKAGQAEQAGAVLSQALDLAHALHAIEDGYTKASALVDIASELIELGQPEQAGPLLSQALDIANTYPRLEDASWAECEHEGEFICGDFEPRSATVSLFVDIAGGLTKAGQTERAGSLLLQAFNLSDGIHWSFIKETNLAEIVIGLVEAGRFAQVLPVANAVGGENSTSRVVSAIAEALARMGQTELGGPLLSRALEMAQIYRDKWMTVLLFVDIAGGLTKAGRTEQAEQIFSQALAIAAAIEDKVAKASALRVIARELTKAGRTEQAEQIFSQALGLANTLKNESGKVKE